MLEPVPKIRLYEGIIKQIQGLIESGRLKPGEKLPTERELTEKLNVSRTSLREALRTLEMMGYLESKVGVNGGTFVKEITVENIISPFSKVLVRNKSFIEELLEVRLVLEIEVARLASIRRNDEDLQTMQKEIENMEEEIKSGGTGVHGDNGFHKALAQATHNEVLLNFVKMFGDLLESERAAHLAEIDGEPQRALKQHKSLRKAIEEKDEEKAQTTMRKHLLNLQNLVKSEKKES